MTVRAVLLNWNSRALTEDCLAALAASADVVPDVLVVDNASRGDDAAHLLRAVGPDRLLALPENRGYAGGMNAGVEWWLERGGDGPVLVITPDARVAPHTVGRLLRELEASPEAGVLGPLVVHSEAEGRVSGGGRVDPARLRTPLLHEPPHDHPYDADWIDGCCMLIRPEVLRDVGGFDERFFAYYEETDFCGRVRRAGWRVRVVPDARVDHPKRVGTLPPHYFYYMVRNQYLFWEKNYGIGPARVAAAVALATARAWGSVGKALLLTGRRSEAGARLRDARLQLRAARVGTVDALRRRYGPMPAARMPPAGR